MLLTQTSSAGNELCATFQTVSAFTVGVSGRVADSDPPSIVNAFQYTGATQAKLVAEFAGWQGTIRHDGGRTVYVIDLPDSPGHAEGLEGRPEKLRQPVWQAFDQGSPELVHRAPAVFACK